MFDFSLHDANLCTEIKAPTVQLALCLAYGKFGQFETKSMEDLELVKKDRGRVIDAQIVSFRAILEKFRYERFAVSTFCWLKPALIPVILIAFIDT